MSKHKILEQIEWACDTIRNKEMFGLDELNASLSRERRAKGVLITCKKEIKNFQNKYNNLKAENEKLNKKLIDAEYAMKKSLLHRDFDDIKRFYKEYKKELEGEINENN